jgi:N-hydroxyarylamine O-acetyltransferase
MDPAATEQDGIEQAQSSKIDLDAYFARIGYAGARTPTLETLRAIQLRHAQAIPFENLNPLLRWPVPLEARSLEQKLVHDGRGGYCFEHNLLLSHALTALDFRVTGLAARVLWNGRPGVVPARGHMLLRVDLGTTPYVVDVGFGGMTLTGPLRLEVDVEQATPHEPFRLVTVGSEFVMQAKVANTWQPLYRFALQEQLLPDYEVINWYLSNHPSSPFVQGLIAARVAPDRRYALRNNELAIHYLRGSTERRILRSGAELRRALEEELWLRLPATSELDPALERLSRGVPANPPAEVGQER